VEDDGRGVSVEKLRRAAVDKGLVTREEASALDGAGVLDLVFRPDFSSRSRVTAMSGRGVGMDVVRREVERLDGAVTLSSGEGRGTRVTLLLPLTLAIARVLIVRAGGHCFAFPSRDVVETVRVERRLLHSVGSAPTLSKEGRTLPVADLSATLGLAPQPVRRGLLPLVILGSGDSQVAFSVENLVGEREVVVKGLGPFLSGIPVVAGATLLGDGSLSLLLNGRRLLEAVGVRAQAPSFAPPPPRPARILVVDDAITVREMMRAILQDAGFEVDTAMDGMEALDRLHEGGYDLVLSDIQMPRMDGLGLARAVRAESALQGLPLVFLTTLEEDDNRQEGLDAGADAYLVKRHLGEGQLLSTIRGLLDRRLAPPPETDSSVPGAPPA
jgi:two-component system chemotaxis sensor kinase CheA